MTQKTYTKQEKDLCLEQLLNWEVWRLLLGVSEFNRWPLLVTLLLRRFVFQVTNCNVTNHYHYTHANLWEYDIEGKTEMNFYSCNPVTKQIKKMRNNLANP